MGAQSAVRAFQVLPDLHELGDVPCGDDSSYAIAVGIQQDGAVEENGYWGAGEVQHSRREISQRALGEGSLKRLLSVLWGLE